MWFVVSDFVQRVLVLNLSLAAKHDGKSTDSSVDIFSHLWNEKERNPITAEIWHLINCGNSLQNMVRVVSVILRVSTFPPLFFSLLCDIWPTQSNDRGMVWRLPVLVHKYIKLDESKEDIRSLCWHMWVPLPDVCSQCKVNIQRNMRYDHLFSEKFCTLL